MRNTLLAALRGILLCVAIEAQSADTNLQAQAQAAFESVEKKFENVRTLEYRAERVSMARRQTVTEKWGLRLRQPDCFALDYQKPEERVIVANQASLWEYIPTARKVQHTDLTAMSSEEKSKLMVTILARVSVDGVRLGTYQPMLQRVTHVAQDAKDAAMVTIESGKPGFTVAVDTRRGVLLSTEIYGEKDAPPLQTRASNFLEISPGFWYPQAVEVRYHADGGLVVGRTTLSDIAINKPMADDVFQFVPPKFATVIESRAQTTTPQQEKEKD